MSFGKNLQFLRKMHNSMTQEELAERMGGVPADNIKMGIGNSVSGNGKSF